jgi:putative tricarboxylic transport membrane protein
LDALLAALTSLVDPTVVFMMFVGIIVGLIIGVLPGLGGIATLALMLPFAYGMEPMPALGLIIGAYSALYFGGSISAILLNLPGQGEQIVTALDGYPLTQQGKGARALGASATATAMGGVIGAVLMIATIPFIREFLVFFRPPEMFILSLFGVAAIGVVSSSSLMKGIISGLLGLSLSFVGYDPLSGTPRYTFGELSLYEGLGVSAMTMGLFAIAEMFYLYTRGQTIVKAENFSLSTAHGNRVIDGVFDTFRNMRTVVESAFIGAFTGIIPGLGGTVAMFFSYARAKQRSRNPETFGRGNILGVIAPEASANAKEGGSFVPTIAFGIPGSSGMAIFIGIFLILGLEPGPKMLTEHLDVTYFIAIVIAVTSVGASVIGMFLVTPMARIAYVRPEILAPMLIAVSIVGSFAEQASFTDVVVACIAGVIGYWMKLHGYSRAGMILGFVMGPLIERYFFLSLQAYGGSFILRPITLGTIAVGLLVVFGGQLRKYLLTRLKAMRS